ncbi:hypothetical protein F5X96DRAFT_667718 [Biscogniauxia mediterranea]|nr:hypothetical protein F5X96DRAFT_667718 [Biscogniauxia mediterranea]
MRATNYAGVAVGALLMLLDGAAAEQQDPKCDMDMVPKELETSISKDAVMHHMQELDRIAHDSPLGRIAGSTGGNATLNYIIQQLSEAGYDVEVVPFHENIQVQGTAKLVTQESALGPISEDYPDFVQGQIALADSNGCSFSHKSAIAKKAGAEVLAVYETTELQPSLGGINSSHIATVKLPVVDAPELLQGHSTDSDLTANITVRTLTVRIDSANIVATSLCGDNHKTLLVGARSDTFLESAGMNDNGSGVAALLETAIQLAKYRTGHKVKFAFWTAGHSGNLGSQAWVKQAAARSSDLDGVKLYVDVNMIASANGFTQLYGGAGADDDDDGGDAPDGSGRAQGVLRDWFTSQGVATKDANFSGRGDYQPFLDAGVAATGLFAGADGIKTAEEQSLSKNANGAAGLPYDPTYHSNLDVINMIDQDLLHDNARAVAHLVAAYAGGEDSKKKKKAAAAEGRAGMLGFSVAAAVAFGWLLCWLGM